MAKKLKLKYFESEKEFNLANAEINNVINEITVDSRIDTEAVIIDMTSFAIAMGVSTDKVLELYDRSEHELLHNEAHRIRVVEGY